MSEGEKTALVVIITEALLESTLLDDLRTLGAKGHTITDARGRGSRGARSGEWDTGSNVRIEVLCSHALGKKILDHVEKHYYENYAMVAFIMDVTVVRPLKFK